MVAKILMSSLTETTVKNTQYDSGCVKRQTQICRLTNHATEKCIGMGLMSKLLIT